MLSNLLAVLFLLKLFDLKYKFSSMLIFKTAACSKEKQKHKNISLIQAAKNAKTKQSFR